MTIEAAALEWKQVGGMVPLSGLDIEWLCVPSMGELLADHFHQWHLDLTDGPRYGPPRPPRPVTFNVEGKPAGRFRRA